MSDQKPRSNRFWAKVAGIGLVAGLIGGGVALGINGVIQHYEAVVSTKVPSGSNQAGGTKVNGNKAELNTASTKAYNSVQGAVVSVINKQKVQQSSGMLGVFGVDETLALQIANIYGTIGTTNFGYFDRVKKGIIAKYDSDKGHVNTFIDDLLAAIVAAVSGKIAHQYA